MRVRIAVIVAVVVAVLAGGGAAYVLNDRQHSHARAGTTTPVPERPTPLSDLGASAAPTRTGVTAVLRRALARSGIGQSVAGVVLDGTTGAQLFARQAARDMAPASALKLFTAAAALTVLRPETTLTTSVARSGNTLYLVGGGDVTLTATAQRGYPRTATLSELAARTARSLAGQQRVRLRYDAGGWSGPTLAPGWTSSYLTSGNVSRLSPLELDEARLTTGLTAPRANDPAQQTADAFQRALTKAGVDVAGAPQSGDAPSSAQRVAVVDSPPVGALVQHMLTTSDNDLAEALGRTVAQKLGQPATFAGAATAVLDAVGKLGVPTMGIHLYDASGLSRRDRVSPRALVSLLQLALHDNTTLAPLVAGLPVAGFTGTLADRYDRGPARAGAGVVRAKTGTLAGVNALAGQVVDTDGRLLTFAFLADNIPAPSVGESMLDRLAAALAGCGCAAT